MQALKDWQNFYVIFGSAAGALIGLQFVVLTLIASIPRNINLSPDAGAAFSTPTIVHFVTVLIVSGIQCIPWQSTFPLALFWGAAGSAGFIYTAVITRQLIRQKVYKPELEDWIFHAVLPLITYALPIVAAFLAVFSTLGLSPSLYLLAIAATLLLLTGIHNAWDNVTYHVFVKSPSPGKSH